MCIQVIQMKRQLDMDKKPLSIKSQIHTMIDTIFSLDVNNSLPELISKHIALQNYILSLRLVEAEVNDYLSDHNVKEYMTKYQLYCLDFEICLENSLRLLTLNFLNISLSPPIILKWGKPMILHA